VALRDDLERIAAAAEPHAAPGEQVAGILATETLGAGRVYLCAYESAEGRTWLALDGDGRPTSSRNAVRDAASIAVLCELAEESVGGGDVDELLARIVELREREAPPGIESAEQAARELRAAIEAAPRLATTDYLDRLGAASRRLEQALGEDAASPFAAAMQGGLAAVGELTAEIERTYKGPLA
jgi:hypothetical protein